MKYFGHIARRGGNSLEKVIMQGCVEGRRKPGRPRTRWIDQIKSMVGCPLHELYNLVQDRQRWCDVVAVASCQSWQDRTDRPTDRPTICIHKQVSAAIKQGIDLTSQYFWKISTYFRVWHFGLISKSNYVNFDILGEKKLKFKLILKLSMSCK